MDQSKAVYSRTRHLEREGGTTRNLDRMSIPGKALPLEAVIAPGSICTRDEWEWNEKTHKGEYKKVERDVLQNAQRSISRGRFTPVTQGHRQARNEALAKAAGQDKGCCTPSACCGEYGHPGSPVPDALSGANKRRY